MDRERLAILKAQMQSQMKEIESIYLKIEERKKKKGLVARESIAYQLHNLYCAFEDLFKIVADTFENRVQDKSQYHIELLKRMSMPIEGVRPALLSQESLLLLDNLRSFRHFFRHAYSYELDQRKLKIVLEDALKLKTICHEDMDAFLNSFL